MIWPFSRDTAPARDTEPRGLTVDEKKSALDEAKKHYQAALEKIDESDLPEHEKEFARNAALAEYRKQVHSVLRL